MHTFKSTLAVLATAALAACGTTAPLATTQPAVKRAPAPPAPAGGKPAPELTAADIERIQQELKARARP